MVPVGCKGDLDLHRREKNKRLDDKDLDFLRFAIWHRHSHNLRINFHISKKLIFFSCRRTAQLLPFFLTLHYTRYICTFSHLVSPVAIRHVIHTVIPSNHHLILHLFSQVPQHKNENKIYSQVEWCEAKGNWAEHAKIWKKIDILIMMIMFKWGNRCWYDVSTKIFY